MTQISPASPHDPLAPLPRSPVQMACDDTALLVVDMQTKLLPSVLHGKLVQWNCRRLLDGAKLLGVPAAATEQYPTGIGPTVPELAGYFESVPPKRAFSCGERGEIFSVWNERGVSKILLVGIETHVCVQQTALDLLAAGFAVYVPVDAVTARFPLDHEVALRRLETSGVTLTTTEGALFEWCATSARPEFKQISALVREAPPDAAP